jgi:hypothetical protein
MIRELLRCPEEAPVGVVQVPPHVINQVSLVNVKTAEH